MKYQRFLLGFVIIFITYSFIMLAHKYLVSHIRLSFPLVFLSLFLSFPGWFTSIILDISLGTMLNEEKAFVFLFSAVTYSGIGAILMEARLSRKVNLIILLGISALILLFSCAFLYLAWAGAMMSG